jgi:hypothetical protein
VLLVSETKDDVVLTVASVPAGWGVGLDNVIQVGALATQELGGYGISLVIQDGGPLGGG